MKRKLSMILTCTLLSVGSSVILQAMQEQKATEQSVLPSALDLESKMIPEETRKFLEEVLAKERRDRLDSENIKKSSS